ncbi:hypothetical protein TELCIR_02794, partial [Teladorsagia circumcincta]
RTAPIGAATSKPNRPRKRVMHFEAFIMQLPYYGYTKQVSHGSDVTHYNGSFLYSLLAGDTKIMVPQSNLTSAVIVSDSLPFFGFAFEETEDRVRFLRSKDYLIAYVFGILQQTKIGNNEISNWATHSRSHKSPFCLLDFSDAISTTQRGWKIGLALLWLGRGLDLSHASVMLALLRYMTLRSRGNSAGTQIGLKHSYLAIGATICFVAVVNAPNFLTYKIHEIRLNDTCVVRDPALLGAAAYLPGIAEIALAKHCLVFRLVFWISGLVFKSIEREVANGATPYAHGESESREVAKLSSYQAAGEFQRQVKGGSGSHKCQSTLMYQMYNACYAHSRGTARGERADRTTNMLLAIVFVMLFTEMPQGIMALLSGMISQEFRRHIYNNLGDLLDLFSLCEACMSFIIYCSMSGQFRNEFRRVFIPKSVHCSKRPPSVRRPSDTYTKMSYLKPNEVYENGSSTYSDLDRSGVVKVIIDQSSSRADVSRITPSPGIPSSIQDELTHDDDNERSRLLDMKNAIVNGSIKEQHFKNI